ncbi:MAG TPA: DUF1761 domain-containing protein [Candidatus Acidoferrum sp.]|nr:DUF1761 domain-containing protein [Candidatus Acidoferrum sp.]
MFAYVSLWGVLLAALSAMIIGTVWYSPMLFGREWEKAIGLKDKDMKKRMLTSMVVLIGVSLLTAYILAHFILFARDYFGGDPLIVGTVTAFWVWLGFGLTTIWHTAFLSRAIGW